MELIRNQIRTNIDGDDIVGFEDETHCKIVEIGDFQFSVVLVNKNYNLRQLVVNTYEEATLSANLLLQLYTNNELVRKS